VKEVKPRVGERMKNLAAVKNLVIYNSGRYGDPSSLDKFPTKIVCGDDTLLSQAINLAEWMSRFYAGQEGMFLVETQPTYLTCFNCNEIVPSTDIVNINYKGYEMLVCTKCKIQIQKEEKFLKDEED